MNPSRAGLEVWVNSTFLQLALDYKNPDPAARKFLQAAWSKWSYPYERYRALHGGRSPRRVLVLGAGTGNDVNVALGNGAEKVVAVDIDPVVLELGVAHNTLRPYSDPRVECCRRRRAPLPARVAAVLRPHHLRDDRLVALVGTQANIRPENYVHTREAILDARSRLSDDGMVAMYYSLFQPWMRSRTYATLRAAFGEHSSLYVAEDRLLFDTVLLGTRGVPASREEQESAARYGGGIPSTDDWPFMYLERPTIAPVYLKLIAMISALILGVVILLSRIEPARGFPLHFLFLGIGFTLLESSAIVRLSLLFGSTWIVNAVVFSSVLAMVFLANWAVVRGVAPTLRWAWPSLVILLVANWAFPLPWLFGVGAPDRALLCGLLIGVPVFCASVCFSRLFGGESATGFALGVNLVGAMAGGLVEYASMVVGMRAIWLVLVGVYAVAWAASFTTTRSRLAQ
jgi:hypothetical protein